MKKLLRFILLFFSGMLLMAFVFSCTSPTTITGTWKKPVIEKNYNDILVAALIPTTASRSSIEQQIVENLREEGINASTSMETIPPKFIENENKKQEILNSIQANGSDGILTVTLLDKDTETRYVPGSGTYAPYPYYRYYGTFWGYYDYWYPRFYDQGYYTQEKVYYIETNLYNADTEELIWSTQSETYNPDELDDFSEEFAEQIIDELENDDII